MNLSFAGYYSDNGVGVEQKLHCRMKLIFNYVIYV